MKTGALLVVGIIIIIMILVYRKYNSSDNDYEKYLYGMWVGSDIFCEEADIDNMLLFIGEKGKDGARNSYLVIGPDIYNDLIKIKCKKAGKKFNAEIIGDAPMPADMTIDLDIMNGRMRMYSGDVLFGVFYKNHEITNESMIDTSAK